MILLLLRLKPELWSRSVDCNHVCTPSAILTSLKSHSARTGRTVFSQLSAAVVRHKANDGVVYAIRALFKYDTALSAVS